MRHSHPQPTFDRFQKVLLMHHFVIKSKIHRAAVTEANLHYEGSLTVDMDILDAANMRVHEQVHVANLNNGDRLVTYIIPGERGSKVICLNGAAARNAQIGDRIIIMSYAMVNDAELESHEPTVIVMDEQNSIQR